MRIQSERRKKQKGAYIHETPLQPASSKELCKKHFLHCIRKAIPEPTRCEALRSYQKWATVNACRVDTVAGSRGSKQTKKEKIMNQRKTKQTDEGCQTPTPLSLAGSGEMPAPREEHFLREKNRKRKTQIKRTKHPNRKNSFRVMRRGAGTN